MILAELPPATGSSECHNSGVGVRGLSVDVPALESNVSGTGILAAPGRRIPRNDYLAASATHTAAAGK